MTATHFAGQHVPDKWHLTDPDAPVELGWTPQLQVPDPQLRPEPQRRSVQEIDPITVSAGRGLGGRLPEGVRRWGGSVTGFIVGCAVIAGGLAVVNWYAGSL